MKKIILLVLAAMSLLVASSASYAWHGRSNFYGSVSIGGPAYYPGYYPGPVYYGPPPVYYAPQPVYIEPEQEYIERSDASAEAPDFKYYCANPKGYYPEVPRCPKGWLKVVPDDSQPR